MTKSIVIGAMALTLAASGITLSGCHEGPAEKAGERIDGKTSGAKDKLTPDGPAEEAGKKIDRAVEDETK
jgi:hypothetical protein